MRRIDRETVQKIIDAADIVDVVSDFVHLKKRGSNYIGLCPFHNERTPSFSVSKSKGICKCFSCGKGGSPINFLMELEQLTFNEALRYLAKKYNIEIEEHEMTEAEREEASVRESMLAVNDFAMHHFESVMNDTEDGRDIGLAYFRERGINDAMIKRFHLGYAHERRDDLYQTALRKGYNEKFLLDTGLCYRTERGTIQDRFRGRVIYPVFTVSGKVVAFGGRTLRKDKDVAKYVNSPESMIYRKSYELYGLYQAKQSIVKKDKCILVEGYMDVISMHQSGIENVVASSGTSLTEGQIRLIHRFTENVTVIYDSDPAGIKASLRGIDLLLAEGLNIKVMLLPEGDDPDSFAQSHTSSEVEQYIAEHEEDFISFKTRILLDGLANDPVARSKAIQNIVQSISMIPDPITRSVYVGECSRVMGIGEKVLTLQVAKNIAERKEREDVAKQRRDNRAAAGLPPDPVDDPGNFVAPPAVDSTPAVDDSDRKKMAFLLPYEREIIRYALKYGCADLCEYQAEDGSIGTLSVIDYIRQELAYDDIRFTNPVFGAAFDECFAIAAEASSMFAEEDARIDADGKRMIDEGIDEIRRTTDDMTMIERKEKDLRASAGEMIAERKSRFRAEFIGHRMLSSPDDDMRKLANDIVVSRHQLSKMHTRFAKLPTEMDRLADLVQLAVYNLKCALIEWDLRGINEEIKTAYDGTAESMQRVSNLMSRASELNTIKKELAKYLGERILSPRVKR
ncbi:MAG: DNA primase [Bacteroides sp.]|nr:DNA primase [Bacteroides sp.]MCM1414086.1 DNA primase [Bacteroides sp.]MCM1472315.1 DNA primase [Bacteroides sp.]